jgi:RNA polymerase sigma-70 factor (ECF subfamily)
VVALNRAGALGELNGPEAALEALDGLELESYHLFHATRAEMLRRKGELAAADQAYGRAIDLVTNHAERRFLEERRESVSA